MTFDSKARRLVMGGLLVVAAAFPMIAWAASGPHDAKPAAAAPAVHAPPAVGPTPSAGPHPKVGAEPENDGAEEAEGEHPVDPRGLNWFDFHDQPYAVNVHGHTVTYAPRPPYGAMLINFIILIAIYYAFGKKPIAAGLQARRDGVAKQIEEAQRMKEEAEERAKMYQAKLARLEDELQTARQALVEAGKGERERIIREAEEKAARMRRDADLRIEQELKQMRQDIWRDAVEQAVSAAEDLLKKRVTQADHERLAEEYLADLGKPAPRAVGGAS